MVGLMGIALLNDCFPFKILQFPLNPARSLLDLLALICGPPLSMRGRKSLTDESAPEGQGVGSVASTAEFLRAEHIVSIRPFFFFLHKSFSTTVF
jgi:hypothetical protein